jgi:HSP20 family molecular chaperone IbpA
MFSDPTKPMWIQALKVLDQADRLQRQFFQLHHDIQSGPVWEPPVDILEEQDELFVQVALPGVDPDNIRVIIDSNVVAIAGVRPFAAGSRAIVRRMEIPYGRFERRIDLKGGNFEIRESIFENGCLRLILKKTASGDP